MDKQTRGIMSSKTYRAAVIGLGMVGIFLQGFLMVQIPQTGRRRWNKPTISVRLKQLSIGNQDFDMQSKLRVTVLG